MVTAVVSDTEFTISGGFTVLTSPLTEFVDLTGVADLVYGDVVIVDGLLDGQLIVAQRVERNQTGGSPIRITGIVASIPAGNRILLEDGTIIRIADGAEFVGFTAPGDLGAGDLIEAEGAPLGQEFLAGLIELIEAAPDPTTVQGSVAFLDPPASLYLVSGLRVVTDAATQWIGIAGYGDLSIGDQIEATGPEELGTLAADTIELLTTPGPVYTTKEGWIFAIPGDGELVLHDDTVLHLAPGLVPTGIPSVADLRVGDRIRVGGYSTGGDLPIEVVELELIERPGEGIQFESLVTQVTPWDNRFRTANGYSVRVTNGTHLDGFEDLTDLVIGATVVVSGVVGNDLVEPDLVEADLVRLVTDEPPVSETGGLQFDLAGLVTQILPTGGFLLDQFTIETVPDTVWNGTLASEADLMPFHGVSVRVAMVDAFHLEAVSVRGLTSGPSERVLYSGRVSELIESPHRVRLDDGTWIDLAEITTVDGDVAAASEIAVGMWLSGEALRLGAIDLLALDAEVGIDPTTVEELGFDNGPVNEALALLDADADPVVVAQRHGAHIAGTLPGRLAHLLVWDAPLDTVALQALLDDEDVVVIEPNRAFTDPESDPESIRRRAIAIDRSPASTTFTQQYAVQFAKLGPAHETSVGENTMVAVIDTGVDPFHPLLRHRLADTGWDLVDNDATPWETADGLDQDGDGEIDEGAGHGTFVSGLVLLAAPATTIVPYRVLNDDGRGTTFAICQAVLLAVDAGVDVINMSFAYPERSRVLDRILKEASERGVFLVSGAGNNGTTVIPFPAMDTRVMAVAALEPDGTLADFSNHGSDVGLSAPGVDLYSSGPNGTFGEWDGTSMAAPLVSGTAALLRSVNPRLTVQQLAGRPQAELLILDTGTRNSSGPGRPGGPGTDSRCRVTEGVGRWAP
jgi:subtilisin family serine protease